MGFEGACGLRHSGQRRLGLSTEADWTRFTDVWLAAHARHAVSAANRPREEIAMADQQTIDQVEALEAYKHGFVTDITMQEFAPKGLSEDTVRYISAQKNEPEWMLAWRLEAFQRWLTLDEPDWAKVSFPKIDYQDAYYYAAPKTKSGPASLDEVDPELLATYAKLGIPLKEQEVLAGVQGAPKYAVDAVFDSVSVVTTFKKELAAVGVIFCSMSRGDPRTPRARAQIPGVQWCLCRTTILPA